MSCATSLFMPPDRHFWPTSCFHGAAGALKAYDKGIELFRRAERARPLAPDFNSAAEAPAQPAGPPVRLLNNAAVLHLRFGDLPKALPLMEAAVQVQAPTTCSI